MEKIVVKREPEEVGDDFKGNMMNYDEPATSVIVIKQEIKEEFNDGDNSMHSDEYGLKEETETSTDDRVEQCEIKFEAEDETLLNKGSDSEDVNEDILEKLLLPEGSRVGKEKLLECDICARKYQSKEGLRRHKKFFHKKDEQVLFKCGQCDYKTADRCHLKRHSNNIHEKKNYLKCNFCEYTTPLLVYLNEHKLRKHKGENEVEITSKIYRCIKCEYSTVRKSHYENHVKVCLKLKNVEWYKCHICQYKTIRKFDLRTHLKKHDEIKKLKCLFCNYKCNIKQHLDNHILTKHLDLLNESNINLITSKFHTCEHCNYKTTGANGLKKHINNNHRESILTESPKFV
ncbi:unnamed protein product [Brassicogethes aeneus]|uniref:C2H2-type domain-containing protein n=1 Tax=Brassicogethes aeneus TaxID=1431903 RepID=A0A9P0FD06_BRAAE|nr:unnamed protein product [Brassicogethes aeneus]